MSAPDTEALVQTVRDAMTKRFMAPDGTPWSDVERWEADALAALDVLAHELKRLKVGRDETAGAYRVLEGELNIAEAELKRLRTPAWDRLAAQEVKRLEAELERVKAERDEAQARDVQKATDLVNAGLHAKAQSAHLDRALAALRRIDAQNRRGQDVGYIARAAIAEIEGETKPLPPPRDSGIYTK